MPQEAFSTDKTNLSETVRQGVVARKLKTNP